jgi:hypothetical protein
MADFVQSKVTKFAVAELADPIADIAATSTIIRPVATVTGMYRGNFDGLVSFNDFRQVIPAPLSGSGSVF